MARFDAHVPPEHRPLTQSPSEEQVGDLQLVADAQITPPGQPVAAGVEQAPAPLQLPAGVSWLPLQDAMPQATLEVANRHPPFPSQVPSCPQAVDPTAHAPPDEPPAATGLQRPVAQVMHVPAQAVAQQTPATQLPWVHWLLVVQAPPSATVAAHVLADVQYPPGQSVSTEQFVAHPAVTEQVNPLQSVVLPGEQVPLPLHVPAEVNPEVPQLAG